MSLRARLFLGVALVNLAAFAILAAAVARDVGRRQRARELARETTRAAVLRYARQLYASFLGNLDFERLSLARLLDQPIWDQADDAYITDFAMDFRGRVVSGDIGLNPLGPYDEEAAARRKRNFDLLVEAYQKEVVAERGEVLAVPLYGTRDGRRRKWGAAYVALAVPELPPPPPPVRLSVVAFALALSTAGVVALVLLLLDVLVLRPLERVAAGAKRVAAGVYGPPVEPTGRDDEIDALIASFNSMMLEVSQQRDQLEKRVEEVVGRMRRAEERLVLADRLAAMGTLAAGIAHEINNPLAGMLNAVRALRRRQGRADERTERYLRLVEEGLLRIRDVVGRVQRFARGGGRMERFSLAEVVEDSLRFLEHEIERAGVEIACDVPADLEVEGDRAALGQVLLNLAHNALDAVRGRSGARVAVRAWRTETGAALEVEDNGVGMAPEVARRAFDPFFTTKPVGAGTGLGLAIVHSIVETMGGHVRIESEVGRGTKVRLEFPLGRDRPERDAGGGGRGSDEPLAGSPRDP